MIQRFIFLLPIFVLLLFGFVSISVKSFNADKVTRSSTNDLTAFPAKLSHAGQNRAPNTVITHLTKKADSSLQGDELTQTTTENAALLNKNTISDQAQTSQAELAVAPSENNELTVGHDLESAPEQTLKIEDSVQQILTNQIDGNHARVDALLTGIQAFPRPESGDIATATRFNQAGLRNLRAKNFQAAVDDFQKAAESDKSDPKYLSNLGYAEYNSDELTAAEKHLFASIALNPMRSVAWGDLAMVYAKLNRVDDSTSALLVGYKVSNGDTLSFLQRLKSDSSNSESLRSAADAALAKLQQSNAH